MNPRLPCLTLLATLLCAAASPLPAQQLPTPTPAQQAGIDKDNSRHFGDSPADPGPLATDLSPALTAAAIDKATRKVADWQLARSQPYFDRIWTWSVLYSGFMAASQSTGDPKYRDAMATMSKGYNYQLEAKLPNADSQSIGQTYLELYLQGGKKDPAMIAPTTEGLNSVIDLPTLKPGDPRIPWWWCDALFMAPPLWARMYAATGDHKYIDYLNQAVAANLQPPLRQGRAPLRPRRHLHLQARPQRQKNLLVPRRRLGPRRPRPHPPVPPQGRPPPPLLHQPAQRNVRPRQVPPGHRRPLALQPPRPRTLPPARNLRLRPLRLRPRLGRQRRHPRLRHLPPRHRKSLARHPPAHLRRRPPRRPPANRLRAHPLPPLRQLHLRRRRLPPRRQRAQAHGHHAHRPRPARPAQPPHPRQPRPPLHLPRRRLHRPQRPRRRRQQPNGLGRTLRRLLRHLQNQRRQPRHRRPQLPHLHHRRPLGRHPRPHQARRRRPLPIRPQRLRPPRRHLPRPRLHPRHLRRLQRNRKSHPPPPRDRPHLRLVHEPIRQGHPGQRRHPNPLLASPRKSWKDGKIVRGAPSYGGWTRAIADRDHVAFIDLNEITARKYDALGPAAVEPLFGDPQTHTTLAGAILNAESVISGLKSLPNNPVANDFSPKANSIPPFTS